MKVPGFFSVSNQRFLVSEKYQRILKEPDVTLSLRSCDGAVGMDTHFTKSQFKQNINFQPTNGRESSHKIQNNANVYSNEVRITLKFLHAMKAHKFNFQLNLY